MTHVTLSHGDIIELDPPQWLDTDKRIRAKVLDIQILEDDHKDSHRTRLTVYIGREDRDVIGGKRQEGENTAVSSVDMQRETEVEKQLTSLCYNDLQRLNFERIQHTLGARDMAVYDIDGDLGDIHQ